MATLLNLQPPAPRDQQPPFAGLLAETCADAAAVRARSRDALFGAPLLAASAIDSIGASDGPLWLRLDIAPDALPATLPELTRIEVECPFEYLDDAVALAHGDPHPLPARLAVRVDPAGAGRGWAAESSERIAAAGAQPVLAAGLAADDVADFLAVLAHSDAGFVAHATTAGEVVAILSATVAALRGDDIPAAFAAADPAPIAALTTAAAEAVREILVAIAVPADAGIAADLRELGITADIGIR
ncbi:hypothetical protein [Rhodococcus sp. Q]|uniref:hypothetical protein n=1 Tax=Rhodococcus sp. Q TaxID=2502252 RepID=UPI0010F92657|nr:hypothetical protein [Rhodococcus sp. Q]